MNFLKKPAAKETSQSRKIELRAMIFTALALLTGLFFVYQVKIQRPLPFFELPAKMKVEETAEKGKAGKNVPEIVNLKQVKAKEDLLPYLTRFENEADRNFAAEKLVAEIKDKRDNIENVGFLASRRVTQKEIENAENLVRFMTVLETAVKRAEVRKNRDENSPVNQIRNYISQRDETVTVSILGGLGSLKNSFIVREPDEFFYSFLIWSIIFFGSFFGLHIFWRFQRFDGDGLILPPLFLLCGIGFLMMISMRDPLRDSLSFADFAFGVLLGCLAVAVITSIDYQNVSLWLQKKIPKFADGLMTYSPIVLAIFLSLALILFGITPGASDAKVNLNIGIATIQPSEIIKILFALFVAFYFAERWEYFRFLEKKRWQFSLPRPKDVWLVAFFVAALLGLFFLQKDLGPALMMAGLFLVLFAVVRQRIGLSIIGFLTIIAGYVGNYFWRISVTAADRLEIWRNPWDTTVSGGEQIVHSLWSFATGGLTGTGSGLGDPYFAPAHHTDLILSSIGEELGFIGLILVFSAYGLLFYRCYVIAKQAFSPFTYFLALGLGVINALQLLFISAGVLGLIPLSGVVTPFLSYGMSSMISNFVSFGILLAISAEKGVSPKDLSEPTKYVAYGFVGLVCIILLKAFIVQVWNSDEILIKNVLAPAPNETVGVVETSGIRRYTYNPRINLAKKELPFGTIYDRNGIPLASSDWEELDKFAEEYESLGIVLKDVCKKGIRCYPFGNKTFHFIGNANAEKNWGANNTAYIEKDYLSVLRGYNDHSEVQKIKVTRQTKILDENKMPVIDPETGKPKIEITHDVDFPIEKKDYTELLPLIHNRYNPINISANLMKYKNRNIKTSIDIRLQLHLTELLKTSLEAKQLKKGAIVVLEPGTGDLLASVSFPIPEDETADDESTDEQEQKIQRDSLLDRARFGTYPPGSTFKIVTGMAAMRKDVNAPNKEFSCIRLSDGRVGNTVRGRIIRDDAMDKYPHENTKFREGLIDSCNAYFAQLGNEVAGANELYNTWQFYNTEIEKSIKTPSNLNLPQASFGQGEITASPFQIAKVSATVSNSGLMQVGRWITDENNSRKDEAIQIITPGQASIIAEAMRGVVTNGTGKSLLNNPVQIAGKTGTAENPFGNSHSWFTGFAPYNNPNQRIAFAVLVENGGAGGRIAAQIAGEVVLYAQKFGIIQ